MSIIIIDKSWLLKSQILSKTYSKVATDLCLSWPKVLNLVTVRGLMKTPV